jgi:transposase
MAPLLRRTWAPRGQTPDLHQRGRHREKVSLAATLWLSPKRDRLRLFWRSLIDAYYNNERIALVLEALLREIPQRLVLVWDRGNMHKGDPIRAQLARFHPRLSLEILPSYAPMLNPVEQVFTWLKHSVLNNYAPADATELNQRMTCELERLEEDEPLLRALWSHSETPIPNVR